MTHRPHIELGVNIDHVATVRQARGTPYPSPVQAALVAEAAGADAITLHLREDRRHIQPRDVEMLREVLTTRMNLESAVTPEMLAFTLRIQPQDACLVPEKREELTTEGGLDVVRYFPQVRDAVAALKAAGIRVSLFVDPDRAQIDASLEAGAPVVEIHTGRYADAADRETRWRELARIADAARHADSLGLQVNAGHGLHYHNVHAIAELPEIRELNIGHAIVAHALFTGMAAAVREMKHLMAEARAG